MALECAALSALFVVRLNQVAVRITQVVRGIVCVPTRKAATRRRTPRGSASLPLYLIEDELRGIFSLASNSFEYLRCCSDLTQRRQCLFWFTASGNCIGQ